ncbi:prepilin peptidase [Listeria riparia]|uniref:Type IV leader peptidase family protein n=1 Tax=Listeria riparia FSL S10-1204 TaxID=1265816 RepID=W7CX54_9LIST|nr:A24 family peptidase [Listeria riparia]EUJ44124.1 type IV leader peptidase family protein [Listeria riparia FSL S10-1204]
MVYFYLVVYSTIFASFLHVLGMNAPLSNTFILRVSSQCDYCGKKLEVRQMIPVISFIMQRGKSTCCHKPMNRTYILVELMSPLFICLLYALYGFTDTFYLYAIVYSLLLILFVSDVLYLCIPDSILLSYFTISATFYFYQNPSAFLEHLYQLIIGLFLFLLLYLIVRNGFGFGDIKLLILLCFLLGIKEVLLVFIIAVFSGLLIITMVSLFNRKLRQQKIPFVPFILIGFIFSAFTGDLFWVLIL